MGVLEPHVDIDIIIGVDVAKRLPHGGCLIDFLVTREDIKGGGLAVDTLEDACIDGQRVDPLHLDRMKVDAVLESVFSNSLHGVGDGHRLECPAVGESFLANAGDTVVDAIVKHPPGNDQLHRPVGIFCLDTHRWVDRGAQAAEIRTIPTSERDCLLAGISYVVTYAIHQKVGGGDHRHGAH